MRDSRLPFSNPILQFRAFRTRPAIVANRCSPHAQNEYQEQQPSRFFDVAFLKMVRHSPLSIKTGVVRVGPAGGYSLPLHADVVGFPAEARDKLQGERLERPRW